MRVVTGTIGYNGLEGLPCLHDGQERVELDAPVILPQSRGLALVDDEGHMKLLVLLAPENPLRLEEDVLRLPITGGDKALLQAIIRHADTALRANLGAQVH